MCYSAQIWASYRKYLKVFGAEMDLQEFIRLFGHRMEDPSLKIPKGLELEFSTPQNDGEREIQQLIQTYNQVQSTKLERELFKQRARLADAERKLQSKVTKAATESQRIASTKVDWCLSKLADLKRTEPKDKDSRIYPGHYAPVMVMEHGKRVVKPMRYQCRPAGKPSLFDSKFPGTYNARRDNLEGFWKDLFGFSHGVMVVNAFFENVNRHRVEGRELAEGEAVENVVLEFRPQPTQDMLVACLWSHWKVPGQPELLSFAAITDEPPTEVSAAGHDRCIVPLKPEHVDRWLTPAGATPQELHTLLEDRARPYYEHRLAA